MDNAIPEENAPTPSRTPQLIDDCRRALRSRSVDRALLQSLLTNLNHEHAALVSRFNRQRPGWNVAGPRDKLRIAADATLRICLKTLQLRLDQLERDNLNTLSPDLFTGTLRVLDLKQVTPERWFERLRQPRGAQRRPYNGLAVPFVSHCLFHISSLLRRGRG